MQILEKTDSPWEFETKGPFLTDVSAYRLFSYRYGLADRLSGREIVPYIWALSAGVGVWQSKWLWGNRKLLAQYGIPFCPEKLPVFSRPQYWRFKLDKRLRLSWRGLRLRLQSLVDRCKGK